MTITESRWSLTETDISDILVGDAKHCGFLVDLSQKDQLDLLSVNTELLANEQNMIDKIFWSLVFERIEKCQPALFDEYDFQPVGMNVHK